MSKPLKVTAAVAGAALAAKRHRDLRKAALKLIDVLDAMERAVAIRLPAVGYERAMHDMRMALGLNTSGPVPLKMYDELDAGVPRG